MSKIMNWILDREEKGEDVLPPLSNNFTDYLAPEVEAPRVKHDYADKGWWKQLDRDMESDTPPF